MFFRSKRQESPSMTLEGVLGPNSRLDEAAGFRVNAPDAICVVSDGRLLFSSANSVFSLRGWGEAPLLWAEFDSSVSALAAAPDGRVAVGFRNGELVVCEGGGRRVAGWATPTNLTSVADCLFLSASELVIVDHGYSADQNLLSVATWDEVGRGRILAIAPSGEPRTVATGLFCPMGVSQDARGDPIVTELERARIIEASGKVRQSGYPAYVARLRKISTGYAMACIGRRDPLIEFLKTEKDFVARMKATIEPRYWIAPRINPEFSHDFPIELGSTRLFGQIKPWAPSFSYGLVIELDENLAPVGSAHSRANGTRHAISDVAEWNGQLVAVSKASGEILELASAGDST